MHRSLNRTVVLPEACSGGVNDRRSQAVPASSVRRQLMGGLLLGTLGLGRAEAHPVPLVAVLVFTGLHALDYLRQGLRELGFVEGQELADGLGRRPQALPLLSSRLVPARLKDIAEFCMRHQLLALSPFGEFACAGGLMSYGPDVRDFYLRTAVFVQKILKGARAGDLPILLPDRFELVLSQRAASTLGLSLLAPLRLAAQEVLQ